MYRIRLEMPKRQGLGYRFLDLLHDALINAWTAAGAKADEVIGADAQPWTFAPLGYHRKQGNLVHSLVVATPSERLAERLRRLSPDTVMKLRPSTGEGIDFAEAAIKPEPDPIAPGQQRLPVLMLSPLAVRDQQTRRWHKNLSEGEIPAAINHRLSRLAGRKIDLRITPDRLYLRANPRHSVLVPQKGFGKGRISFVIGLSAPLLLEGSEEDLRFAWYAGIGEKNRNGFGCLGLLEEGVGR